MDNQDSGNVSFKDLPAYHWHNKEEGKEEYARFAKQFKSALKHLRYILEPGGVQRRLGPDPGPAPAQAAARREWREDTIRYEAKLAKVEEHFAAALSALENSFVFATSPRHIIDVAIDNPPDGLPLEQWTYQMKFQAAWEALRLEYQPSTVVDLSQLKDQIRSLSDQVPGGFDHFKSEFLRLHTEILATGVPDAITARELNGIAREGLKNPIVWQMVGHQIYSVDDNAPWERTFDEVSKLLTSYRQKGIDPYGEAHGGPLIGHTPIGANSANMRAGESKGTFGKRSATPSRDSGGKFHKSQKTDHESSSQSKRTSTSTTSYNTSASDRSKPRSEVKCTRCWQNPTNHNYRNCTETKCVCGQPLSPDQPICYNYDNHPASAKFTESVPKMLVRILEAYKRGSSGTSNQGSSSNKPKPMTTRSKNKKGARAMAASLAEEMTRRGVTGENLDHEA